MFLATFFYSLSLLAQLIAVSYAANLFLRAKAYRLTCGFLLIALGLMLGRRISPILHVLDHSHINLTDAVLSVPISLFLMLGMIQLRKVFIRLEDDNARLDLSSKVDSLTGALSRAEVFSRSEVEIERSLRNGHSLSFLMVDIDHFKNVNDRYGHPVGDLVLSDLVRHCQYRLRSIDIFGRVGGEEFFIVLPESSDTQALQAAERLRQHIASSPSIGSDGSEIFITISIGIATFNPQIECKLTPANILRRYFKFADDAMYQAKANGRNQCQISEC